MTQYSEGKLPDIKLYRWLAHGQDCIRVFVDGHEIGFIEEYQIHGKAGDLPRLGLKLIGDLSILEGPPPE